MMLASGIASSRGRFLSSLCVQGTVSRSGISKRHDRLLIVRRCTLTSVAFTSQSSSFSPNDEAPVQIRRSDVGWGVFAARDLRRGEVLFPFRAEEWVSSPHRHTIQVDWDWHIRPTPPATYLNHCCNEANVGIHLLSREILKAIRDQDLAATDSPETICVDTSGRNSKDLTIGYFVALKEIPGDGQLLWDYETTEYSMADKFPCKCGSQTCRGFIQGYAVNGEQVLEAYGAEYVAPYLLQKTGGR